MSDTRVIAVAIDVIKPHPNADRLDLATIGGYTTIVGKGEFQPGDIVSFFPPDILIPESIATQLGVVKYLKSAVYPGDTTKTNCRVAATRLRGVPSFGFVCKVTAAVGTDLTEQYRAVKYEPPEPLWFALIGDAKASGPKFHVYTDVENYRNSRFKGAFETGLPVRVTEKIHGTNSRVALLDGEFHCGSHNCNKKEYAKDSDKRSVYWNPLTEDMKALLSSFDKDVIVFGEIFGNKIQFMDYGIIGYGGYRVFDISVNGQYLNWGEVESVCRQFNIQTVPLLYLGPFYDGLVESLVDGPTTIVVPEQIKSSFKGREGIVITPLFETYSDIMGGRLIAKAVSCDYLDKRKSDSH